jgi:hypothetical protein
MLQEEATDLGQEDFISGIQKIQAAGKHLPALINDILDLSKVEARNQFTAQGTITLAVSRETVNGAV